MDNDPRFVALECAKLILEWRDGSDDCKKLLVDSGLVEMVGSGCHVLTELGVDAFNSLVELMGKYLKEQPCDKST